MNLLTQMNECYLVLICHILKNIYAVASNISHSLIPQKTVLHGFLFPKEINEIISLMWGTHRLHPALSHILWLYGRDQWFCSVLEFRRFMPKDSLQKAVSDPGKVIVAQLDVLYSSVPQPFLVHGPAGSSFARARRPARACATICA